MKRYKFLKFNIYYIFNLVTLAPPKFKVSNGTHINYPRVKTNGSNSQARPQRDLPTAVAGAHATHRPIRSTLQRRTQTTSIDSAGSHGTVRFAGSVKNRSGPNNSGWEPITLLSSFSILIVWMLLFF